MTPTDQPAAGDAESERPRSEHVTWNRPPLAFLTGQLLLVELLGGIAHLHAQIGEHRVIAAAPPDHGYRIDAPIRFAVDPARIHLFGADGRSLIT